MRINLKFKELVSTLVEQNVCFWFDKEQCHKVADLCYLIRSRFLETGKQLSLYTDSGFFLPHQECIDVVKENDVLQVRLTQKAKGPSSSLITRKRKRASSIEDDSSSSASESESTTNPSKKLKQSASSVNSVKPTSKKQSKKETSSSSSSSSEEEKQTIKTTQKTFLVKKNEQIPKHHLPLSRLAVVNTELKTASKNVVSKNVAAKNVVSKNVVSKNVVSKNVVSKNVVSKNVVSKDVVKPAAAAKSKVAALSKLKKRESSSSQSSDSSSSEDSSDESSDNEVTEVKTDNASKMDNTSLLMTSEMDSSKLNDTPVVLTKIVDTSGVDFKVTEKQSTSTPDARNVQKQGNQSAEEKKKNFSNGNKAKAMANRDKYRNESMILPTGESSFNTCVNNSNVSLNNSTKFDRSRLGKRNDETVSAKTLRNRRRRQRQTERRRKQDGENRDENEVEGDVNAKEDNVNKIGDDTEVIAKEKENGPVDNEKRHENIDNIGTLAIDENNGEAEVDEDVQKDLMTLVEISKQTDVEINEEKIQNTTVNGEAKENSFPVIGSVVVFQELEMSQTYTPEIVNKQATVVSYDKSSDIVKLSVKHAPKAKGDGRSTCKFEMPLSDSEEGAEEQEEHTLVTKQWSEMKTVTSDTAMETFEF